MMRTIGQPSHSPRAYLMYHPITNDLPTMASQHYVRQTRNAKNGVRELPSTGTPVQFIQRFVLAILLTSVNLDLKQLAKPPTYHKKE
jgi:hypothetical protein